jgi:5-formyltetrahydrofolate cyclo-ligase
VTDPKRELRRRLLGVRRSLTPADLQRAAEGLAEAAGPLLRKRCVALYVAVPPEPETGLLLSRFEAGGTRVLLPVLHDDNDLGWGESGAGLVPGRFGLSEPAVDLGVDAIRDAEAVLCPALAVDRAGARLGRGGGSYDRALARVAPGVPLIAVVYDAELVDELPADPHDRPVTHVLTPAGLRERAAG